MVQNHLKKIGSLLILNCPSYIYSNENIMMYMKSTRNKFQIYITNSRVKYIFIPT